MNLREFLYRLHLRSPLLPGEDEAIVTELLAFLRAAPSLPLDRKGRRVWPSDAKEPYSSKARKRPNKIVEDWPMAPYIMVSAYQADKFFSNLGIYEVAAPDSDPRLRARI